VDFTYTPRMTELKARAAELAGKIMVFEDECEADNGLSAESHATVKAAVLEHGLNAINHPVELGGAGLTILEQAVVQEELGRLTGALWDTVWRPANPLGASTEEQRERWLVPGILGERRDAVAITESSAGSDPSRIRTTARRAGDRYVINGY
jgi:acyl-CoA dehydrogenase